MNQLNAILAHFKGKGQNYIDFIMNNKETIIDMFLRGVPLDAIIKWIIANCN